MSPNQSRTLPSVTMKNAIALCLSFGGSSHVPANPTLNRTCAKSRAGRLPSRWAYGNETGEFNAQWLETASVFSALPRLGRALRATSRGLPALASALSSFPSRAPSQSASAPPRSLLSGGLRMSSPAALLSPSARRKVGRVALVSHTRPRAKPCAAALRGGSAGSAVTGKQALLSFLLQASSPNPAVNRTLRHRASFLSLVARPPALSLTVCDAQRRLPLRWAAQGTVYGY